MPTNVTGTGTVWNLPNYAGELFTASQINTPFLTMIGGLSGGGQQTQNFEFPTYSDYELPAAAQPAITETQSLTAPDAEEIVRGQATNVTQIFQEKISISYVKQSNGSRLQGLNTAGQQNNAPSEKDFQIARKLEKIARDVNYTFINGIYQKSTASNVANKTRGVFELASTVNTLAAAGAELTKAMIDGLLLEMFNNGAKFENMVLFTNGSQKQRISGIYGYAPQDRNVGGVNIQQIETDFGNIGIVLDRMVPAGNIGLFEMSEFNPVFQPVPGKGNFFYEELAKTGAAEEGQMFGQIGLAHGPAFLHGSITGLKV
ncbi:SU10 major capsid protein [Virgibacillus halodenitrificans]|uniref:DUF5309 family protein n=1 Tax=Virgibacillus halodenitrificans TaxID=1482 RepID=A0ABR7VN05_VIRHA|nr:DUF5309 family protein [Virgibacillus halodenitrificans]MBD1223285.1 DUF5309 family protein [Virgibacillus halodenitrificans]